MMSVYVLNNSGQCISTTSVERAIVLVRKGHADVVKWSDKVVRTIRETIRIPLIIRIFRWVKAYGRALKFDRRFVWERDNYICQYCGVKIVKKADLTTDHVFPESKGGRTVYENMVTCCRPCNAVKDNKTCAEAKMWPKRTPVSPMMSKNMARMTKEAERLIALEYKEGNSE